MPAPIIEQIAQAIQTKVASVTTANGYQQTIAACVRPNRMGKFNARHLTALMIQTDPKEIERSENNGPCVEWQQPYHINVFLAPPEASTDPIDGIANTVAADITKAVMTDVYHGSLAIATDLGPLVFWQVADSSFEGVTIPFLVRYRVLEADPYTNRR